MNTTVKLILGSNVKNLQIPSFRIRVDGIKKKNKIENNHTIEWPSFGLYNVLVVILAIMPCIGVNVFTVNDPFEYKWGPHCTSGVTSLFLKMALLIYFEARRIKLSVLYITPCITNSNTSGKTLFMLSMCSYLSFVKNLPLSRNCTKELHHLCSKAPRYRSLICFANYGKPACWVLVLGEVNSITHIIR